MSVFDPSDLVGSATQAALAFANTFSSAPGEGMTSDYRCEECTSDGLVWEETTCALEGMTGIANER